MPSKFVLLLLFGTTALFGCTWRPENKTATQPIGTGYTSSGTPASAAGKAQPAPQATQAGQKGRTTPSKEVSLSSPAGAIPAPEIKDLELQTGPETGMAQYLDKQGQALLLVDALPLNENNDHSAMLKKLLDKVYGASSPYLQAAIYPQFHYPLEGVKSGFFSIDVSLTAPQVELLNEALDLFARPEFVPLKPELFDAGIAYVLIDKIANDTAGLTFAGTGVVELNRSDLFGSRYLLASVIAHEGSHVLQGAVTGNATCADSLRREVGNQAIPAGFYQWDAARLLNAVKDEQIGAYHVSLWMLTHLGVQDTAWVVQAIETGKVGSDPVVNCKL